MIHEIAIAATGFTAGVVFRLWVIRRKKKREAKKSGNCYEITLLDGRVYVLYPETRCFFYGDIELEPFPITEPFYIVRAYDDKKFHQIYVEIRLIRIDGHEMPATCRYQRPWNVWHVLEGRTLDQVLRKGEE